MIEGLWPYLVKYLEPILIDSLNLTLEEIKPGYCKVLQVSCLNLGHTPPKIRGQFERAHGFSLASLSPISAGIKSYSMKTSEELVVDMQVKFKAQSTVSLGEDLEHSLSSFAAV